MHDYFTVGDPVLWKQDDRHLRGTVRGVASGCALVREADDGRRSDREREQVIEVKRLTKERRS